MVEWVSIETKSDNVPSFTPIKGKITVMLARLAPNQDSQVLVADWARRHGEDYAPGASETRNYTIKFD